MPIAALVELASLPQESRRCKHCGDTVVGDHEARREHRLSCSSAPPSSQQIRSASALGGGNQTSTHSTRPVAVQGIDVSKLSHREQLELLTNVVCRFCGLPHDVNECMEKLPHGYRERLKCNAADHLTRGRIPFSQRKCVTPDLIGFDKKMDKLVKKIVPMSSVVNAIAEEKEATRWKRCAHCRKRVIAKFFVQHATHSCTVQQILRRVLALEILLGVSRGSPHDEDNDSMRLLEHRLAVELLEESSAPILTPLPASVRKQEQIALLVGSVNAVVPISDLVAPNEGAGDAMHEAVVRDALPQIRSRVEDWAAEVRRAESGGGHSISSIIHAPPLLLLSGANTNAASPVDATGSTPPSASSKQKTKGKVDNKKKSAQTAAYSRETEALARQLNNGTIVSLADQRQQQEFFAKRAAGSTSNSPSRVGSASSSNHRTPHVATSKTSATSRPTSAAEGSGVVLPPLVPKKEDNTVHQPTLD